MSKVPTLTGLETATKLIGVSNECTPVVVFSPALDMDISVCEEQLTEVRRRRGRLKTNSSETRRASRSNTTKMPVCPRDKRAWVTITRNGKQEKRCRCNIPGKGGNRRYLKNVECQ